MPENKNEPWLKDYLKGMSAEEGFVFSKEHRAKIVVGCTNKNQGLELHLVVAQDDNKIEKKETLRKLEALIHHPGSPMQLHAFLLSKKIDAAVNQFNTTGVITPTLVALFDQHGKWSKPKLEANHAGVTKLMAMTLAPSDRETTNERGEPVLLTSFLEKPGDDFDKEMLWAEVCGNITLERPRAVFPNLRKCKNLRCRLGVYELDAPLLEDAWEITTSQTKITITNLKRAIRINVLDSVNAPNLITCPEGIKIPLGIFDSLISCGNIEWETEEPIVLPKLEICCGNIEAKKTSGFHAPKFKRGEGQLKIGKAKTIRTPLLSHIAGIDGDSCEYAEIQNLKYVKNNINTNNPELVLNELLECDSISNKTCTKVSLEKLKGCHTLRFPQASELEAGNLQGCYGKIVVGDLTTLNLPSLTVAGEIVAISAKVVSLPKLERVISMQIPNAETVDLENLLATSVEIQFDIEAKIHMPKSTDWTRMARAVDTLDIDGLRNAAGEKPPSQILADIMKITCPAWVEKNREKCAQALMKIGANPNAPVLEYYYSSGAMIEMRTTPLMIAALLRRNKCVIAMLRKGGDPAMISNIGMKFEGKRWNLHDLIVEKESGELIMAMHTARQLPKEVRQALLFKFEAKLKEGKFQTLKTRGDDIGDLAISFQCETSNNPARTRECMDTLIMIATMEKARKSMKTPQIEL